MSDAPAPATQLLQVSALAHLLGEERLPPLTIVDVGAMLLGTPLYQNLLAIPGSSVVGFEPGPEEFEKLAASAPPNQKFFPYFVGDGQTRTFHFCKWAATSSLYAPNRKLLERFEGLAELVELSHTETVETTRLDDIPDLPRLDFAKIDVQGATLDVLKGGPTAIGQCLAVQTEVEFVPLYEDQPLFAEVDQEMRRLGFLFHCFTPLKAGSFAPLRRKPEAGPAAQLLWSDAVYFRSFLEFSKLPPTDLLKLALIAEVQYRSRDLALLAVQHYDHQTGDTLWEQLVRMLTGDLKEKPALLL